MKFMLVLILSLVIACNTVPISDQGFTDRKEAKNLMVDGLKEGKWVQYGYLLWILKFDTLSYTLTVYKDDVPYGKVRKYYMNGNLEGETYYKDGKVEGVAKGYYKSGVLRAENYFANNMYNGSVKSYFSNGVLDSEATYINGVPDGTTRFYHANGKIKSEETWKNGKKISTKDYPENDYN